MESRWTPETSKKDLRGQISMARGAIYIIGKLLKHRCLKWARIAHLDIWNTSYGQKKGRESNSREFANFDSRPLIAGNRPEILGCRWRATYHWKALDENYNFALDRVAIRGLLAKLCGYKVARVLLAQFRDSHAGVPRESRESWDKKAISMWAPWRGAEYTIGSKGVAYSRVRAVVSLVCPSARGLSQHPRVSRMLN